MEYNEAKSSIDQSDQMASYNSPLRKSLKWYRKLAVEFLLGTSLVNSHIIFNQLADKKMKINEFREHVIKSLLSYEDNIESQNDSEREQQQIRTTRRSMQTHTLVKKEGPYDKMKKYCKGCYKENIRGNITKNQVKKVVTYCDTCEGERHLC
ncbi:uncharacterized protein [Diabrotica undecimpunctata]|uniref:uncharacterized protein n=1 Tax=Diabrotica undecimpunctata TaxID=50387 RepID=UPI003B6407DA